MQFTSFTKVLIRTKIGSYMNVIYDANEHIVKTACTDFVTKDTVLGNIAARLFQYGIQVTAETVVSVIQLQLSKEQSKEATDLYRFLDNFIFDTWGNINAITAMICYTDIFGTTAGHDRLIELDLGYTGTFESARINVIVACCNIAMITYNNSDYDFWRRHVMTNYILTYFKDTTKEYRKLFSSLIGAIIPKKYVNTIDVEHYLYNLVQPLTRECLLIEPGCPHFLHDLFEEFPREGATAGTLYMGFLNRNVRSSMFETLINMYGSRNTFDFHGPLIKHNAEVDSISQYIMSFFKEERFVMKLSSDNTSVPTRRTVTYASEPFEPTFGRSTTLYPSYFVAPVADKYLSEVTDALKQFKQCGNDFIKLIKWREDHIELLKKIYPKMDPDVDVDTMVFLLNDRYPDIVEEKYDTTDLPVNLDDFEEYGKPVNLDEYDEVFTDSISDESDTIDLGDFTFYDSDTPEDEDSKYLM